MLNPVRRAGIKFCLPDHEFSHIDRVEPVYILIRVYGIEHLRLINVFRERQLNKYAMNFRIIIILADESKEHRLGHILGYILLHGIKTKLFRGLLFPCNIAYRRRVATHDDCHQTWRNAALFL